MSLAKNNPVSEATVVAVETATGQSMDVVAFANLANVDHLEFKQGNVLAEALTGGCAANSYMISDRTAKWNAAENAPNDRAKAEKDTPIGEAFFLMKEESSCWCRACCNPAQPALVKFYNTGPGQVRNGMGCGPCKQDDYKVYPIVNDPVLTFEKGGNCDNCAQCGPTNCFVCCAKCQSHAWIHNGNVQSEYAPKSCVCCEIPHWEFENNPGLLETPRPNAFAHSVVPIGGGGCTPTVNVMERYANNNEQQFAVIQGPTFFGGCMDLCCSTKFTVSRAGDKSGDLAIITKKNKDPGCIGLCVALCTPADTYNLDFSPGHKLSATQKAAIIGEMIHLDFLFFEAEQPICREDESACYLLLCTCYLAGCLCPIQCIFPKKKGGD